MTGDTEWPLPPPVPVRFTLTSVVVLFVRLRRKTSRHLPLSSFVTRLLAVLRKRTNLPSALMTDAAESLLPPTGLGMEGLANEIASTAGSASARVAAIRIKPSNRDNTASEGELLMNASINF